VKRIDVVLARFDRLAEHVALPDPGEELS
jgi:hypothetical protein